MQPKQPYTGGSELTKIFNNGNFSILLHKNIDGMVSLNLPSFNYSWNVIKKKILILIIRVKHRQKHFYVNKKFKVWLNLEPADHRPIQLVNNNNN